MPPSMQNSLLATPSASSPLTHLNSFSLERKLKKPLMEKRRRARMNECLDQLKNLLLNVAPHQHSKLEKADILEMTVAFLKNHYESKNSKSFESQKQMFFNGFSMAAVSCIEFLQSAIGDNGTIQAALLQHLQTVISAQMLNFGEEHTSVPSPINGKSPDVVSPKLFDYPTFFTSANKATSIAYSDLSYSVDPKWGCIPSARSNIVASASPPIISNKFDSRFPSSERSACNSTSDSKSRKRLGSQVRSPNCKVWRPF